MVKHSTLAVKAGVVILSGLILLIGFSLKSDGRSWFYKGYGLTAQFETAKGIEPGSRVVQAGVPIGRVKSMELVPADGTVRLHLLIDEPNQIRKDAKASIRLKTMLGNYQLYINPGSPGAELLADGDALETEGYKDIQDVLAQLGDVTAGPSDLFGKIGDVVDENRDNIRDATSSLAEVGPKLNSLIERLDRVSAGVEEGKGTLGKLTSDDELYNKIDATVEDLRAFSAQLNSSDGALGKFTNDEEFAARIDRISLNLETFSNDLKQGKGTIGRLMSDEALANKIDATFTNTEAATSKVREILERNEANIDTAIASAGEAMPKLNNGLDHFVSVSKKIDEGEGTLGLLVNDPEVYNGIRDAVNQIKRTFEEGEEQSVMRTFLGVFFGSAI